MSDQSRRAVWWVSALVSVAVLAACTPAGQDSAGSGTSAAPIVDGSLPVGDKTSPMPAPGTCKLGSQNGQPLPDRACTPGATNPAVTPDTINDTICKAGWTKTVRPSSSVTGRMKIASAKSYSLPTDEKSEYDHLVSLELGGAPDDPRNLWVEPGGIPNPKDAVENALNRAVCSRLVTLVAAQNAIAVDWVTAFDTAGLRVAGGKVCLRDNPAQCATGRR